MKKQEIKNEIKNLIKRREFKKRKDVIRVYCRNYNTGGWAIENSAEFIANHFSNAVIEEVFDHSPRTHHVGANVWIPLAEVENADVSAKFPLTTWFLGEKEISNSKEFWRIKKQLKEAL